MQKSLRSGSAIKNPGYLLKPAPWIFPGMRGRPNIYREVQIKSSELFVNYVFTIIKLIYYGKIRLTGTTRS
jgi:hypothetical protein